VWPDNKSVKLSRTLLSNAVKIFIKVMFNYSYSIQDIYMTYWPTTVAARRKAWICGRLLAEIAGSNSAGRMDVC
jgi:hypothetical protein